MTSTPHYLRVARALALVTGLAGVSTGCGDSHGRDDAGGGMRDSGPSILTDAGPPGFDAGPPGREDAGWPLSDAGAPPDAGPHVCETCSCAFGADAGPLPLCQGDDEVMCCLAIGPLFPPSVAA